jgi:aminopeptidase N
MKLALILVSTLVLSACAQAPPVRSKATMDSGAVMSENLRAYSIEHYALRNDILIDEKAIAGSGAITFRARSPMNVLELDLDGLFSVDNVHDAAGDLSYTRSDSKLFIDLSNEVGTGETHTVTIRYHGQPREAERAPWDGGFVWKTTTTGEPWIATALQGEGCDLWWPCKDHPDGEPASMDLYFTVPEGLTAASNGVLVDVATANGRSTFHWKTSVPTNTYGIALNIGPYVLIEDTYDSINGTEIPVKFWALQENEAVAREFFDKEFADTIAFFEDKIGPYPWGQEKLGVVETPHYGMEHQSIIAYGRNYRRKTYGFDYILNHELAHEWFGNVMTHSTPSDLWLHEGFATFMQAEYSRQYVGEAAYHTLHYRTDLQIKSCYPIAPREYMTLGELYSDDDGGKGPTGDIYSKGSAVLRSLEYVVGEETLWRSIQRLVFDTTEVSQLKAPIETRYRSTDDFVSIAGDEAGTDLAWFFEVYARRGPLPEIILTESDGDLILEWVGVDDLNFPMPLPVSVNGEMQRVEFSDNRATLANVKKADVLIDPLLQILRKIEQVPTCEERRAEAAEAEAAAAS